MQFRSLAAAGLTLLAQEPQPCRARTNLAKLSEEIEIFGIAYKDKPEDTRGFLATYGDPFAGIGIDRDGDAGMRWGVYGVPETPHRMPASPSRSIPIPSNGSP